MLIAIAGLTGVSIAAAAEPTDSVPERWILGHETIEGQTLDVAERLRVLPGARLDIIDSTLRFQSHASGPTGLVAEAGSDVRVLGSQLLAAAGAPGSFLVHLEGKILIESTTIRGASAVVIQPRSLTDHIDDTAGGPLEGQVPGWRILRTLTNGSALLRGVLIEESAGPGLVAGAPLQYQAALPPPRPALRIEATTIRATNGPAVHCYATHQDPDPDRPNAFLGGPIPILDGPPFSELVIADSTLESEATAVVHCPPGPVPYVLPRRNLPVLDPETAGPVNALLPPPPAPEAVPGPGLLRIEGGTITGPGVGVLLDASTNLASAGTAWSGLEAAVRLMAVVNADIVDPLGAGLADGFDVRAGSLTLDGGDVAGAGVGVRVAGGAADVSRTTVRGFQIGVAAAVPVTVANAILEDSPTCALLLGTTGGSIRDSTLRNCGIGLALNEATGAEVTGNRFEENADPLQVVTPDDAAHPEHFDHTVTANTVHGKALLYLFQAAGVSATGPVGHAVIAHSGNVRVSKLDVAHGTYHVHASVDVVLGTLTDQQPRLASIADAALAQAFFEVWQGVHYEVYPGALKGSQGALDQGTANDVDQSWLLLEKAGALGKTARFVQGDLAVARTAFLTWTGFTDDATAFTQFGLSGGLSPSTFFKDHTWVEVEVQPGLWLELDPSYAQYEWMPVAPLPEEGDAGSIADTLVDQLTFQDADILTATDHAALEAELSRLDGVASVWTDEQVAADAGLRETFGGPVARAATSAEEPVRTPEARLTAIPDASHWGVDIRLGPLAFSGTTPALYGKPVTIGSAPATADDVATIEAAGGMDKVSRFAVDLVTTLYVDGTPVGSDGFAAPHPGDELLVEIDFRAPGGFVPVTHDSPIHVGGAYALALDIGRTPARLVLDEESRYHETLDAMLAVGAADGDMLAEFNVDQRYGRLMQIQGWHYFARVHDSQASVAGKLGVQDQPLLGAAVTGQAVIPVFKSGIETVQQMPPHIDVQFLGNSYPRDGDADRNIQYALQAGAIGSMFEGHVFLELYGTQGLSTVHVLQEASRLGQKIYRITPDNLESQLALTNLPVTVENAIRQGVVRGMDVYVHHQQITIENWTGAAWIEFDPATGANGWLIYGGVTPLAGESLVLPHAYLGGSGVTWEGFLNWLKSGLLLLLRAIGSPAAPWMGLITGLVDLVLKYQEFSAVWEGCQGVNSNPDMRVRGQCVQEIFPVAFSMLMSLVLVSVSIACLLLGGLLCFFFLGVAIARFLIATIGLFE